MALRGPRDSLSGGDVTLMEIVSHTRNTCNHPKLKQGHHDLSTQPLPALLHRSPQKGETPPPLAHGSFDDTLKATGLTRTPPHPRPETRPGPRLQPSLSVRRRHFHRCQVRLYELERILRRYLSRQLTRYLHDAIPFQLQPRT